jgi:hypothetical protein
MSGGVVSISGVRRILFVCLALLVIVGGLTVVRPVRALAAEGVELAADAGGFDPGNIISDSNFFDGAAMSAADVQSFLNTQVSSCVSGYTCLKDLRVDTWNIPATPMCSAYSGAPGETAATIIYKVGRACGISQAVILVTLQKEQSLVTNRSPSLHAISAAMGVGCYDNGQPCVGEYAGFFNQLFNGAYLLKRYTQPPGTGSGTPYPTRFDLSYPVGQTSQILYHPNRDCGTKSVHVANQATHSLYVYTPYTPNAAAMANLYGTGDGCSSYGNRNFWRIYSDWFGNPNGSRRPSGWMDSVSAVGLQVTAVGWAIGAETVEPIEVALSVDGAVVTTATADAVYPGLESFHPTYGNEHGFSVSWTLTPGQHQVCTTALNDSFGSDTSLGCRTVTVTGSSAPIGWLDAVDVVGSTVTARGWTFDGDTVGPISVSVSVDGVAQEFVADVVYPGLGSIYSGFGDAHGFSASVGSLAAGKHTVCVTALNDAAGPDRGLGCRTVTVIAVG